MARTIAIAKSIPIVYSLAGGGCGPDPQSTRIPVEVDRDAKAGFRELRYWAVWSIPLQPCGEILGALVSRNAKKISEIHCLKVGPGLQSVKFPSEGYYS